MGFYFLRKRNACRTWDGRQYCVASYKFDIINSRVPGNLPFVKLFSSVGTCISLNLKTTYISLVYTVLHIQYMFLVITKICSPSKIMQRSRPIK